MNDSYRYRGSIFQQEPADRATDYLEVDREVVHLLYDPRVRVGMRPDDVRAALTAGDRRAL